MDPARTLALFDSEMRAEPPEEDGYRIEQSGRVVRQVGEHSWISYSSLDAASAPGAIREQSSFFRSSGKEVEWKVYGHDLPADLGELLRRAGFAPDPPETLMAFDLSHPLAHDTDVDVRRVADSTALAAACQVSREAFGPDRGWDEEEYRRRLSDPRFAALVAYVDGEPVASGRLELPAGRSFASLWGGGTSPLHRGKGIFRSLVAARAGIARDRGFRFLTVDALPSSRPILERIGFTPLTTVTGWILKTDSLAESG